jgi:hypothetical protein
MRAATRSVFGVLAIIVGHVLLTPTPAVAQPYKAGPPAEAAPPAEEAAPPAGDNKHGAQRVPRRRPATAEEVKPVTDPALSDQCTWIGKRIISLLVRDDPVTANDFSPFYVRFGCPEARLNKAFGCLVANLMTIENNALADQADECWRNPDLRYVPVGNGKSSPIEPTRAKAGSAPAAPPPAATPPPEGAAPQAAPPHRN